MRDRNSEVFLVNNKYEHFIEELIWLCSVTETCKLRPLT
jgi:hypothetical protein